MVGNIDRRLADLGITLPDLPAAVGSYLPYAVLGELVFVSGQLPWDEGRIAHPGRLGAEVPLDDGIAAARLCALALVAQMREACAGDLDRVRSVVRLGGFVSSAADFFAHAEVMNGASDLMAQIFGEAGRHTRAAVGVASLPLNAPVEIEGVFWIKT